VDVVAEKFSCREIGPSGESETMKWSQWIGHGVIGLSFLLMLATALSYKLWHRTQARRSPLQGRKIGNMPGQQLLKRISHHETEVMTAIAMMYTALPLMFMVWASIHLDWAQIRWRWIHGAYLFAALVLFLWGFRDYVRNYRARERVRDGWTAEHVTGLQLNRLVMQGCTVLHDVPADGFNIDHVVIAPRAIYAVETKSFRKPKGAGDKGDDRLHHVSYDGKGLTFPDFATTAPVEQAARQAQWLRRHLRDALGQELPVVAAVSLPGWFIDKTEGGKRADIQVFTPMGKGADFMAWAPERMDPLQRKVIAETLAARYPSIDS